MTDDPRDILRAAGVECKEVEEYSHTIGKDDAWMLEDANAAILALARLVAKYKWQRDEAIRRVIYYTDEQKMELGDIELAWEELHS